MSTPQLQRYTGCIHGRSTKDDIEYRAQNQGFTFHLIKYSNGVNSHVGNYPLRPSRFEIVVTKPHEWGTQTSFRST